MSDKILRGTYSHQGYQVPSRNLTSREQYSRGPVLYSQEPHIPQNAQALQNCTIQGNSNRFCDKSFSLDMNANQYSVNQALVGVNSIENMNPRLLIPPIIAPRSHDLDSWRANNLVVHSHINEETNTDTYQSGYDISECCDYLPPDTFLTPNEVILNRLNKIKNGESIDEENGLEYIEIKENYNNNSLCENYNNNSLCENYNNNSLCENYNNVDKSQYGGNSNYKNLDRGYKIPQNIRENYTPRNTHNPQNIRENYTYNCGNNCNTNTNNVSRDYYVNVNPTNTYEYPYPCNANYHENPTCPKDGDINTQCGYNPDQLFTNNLPTNYLSGECSRNENFSEYNKNLFTNTLQPGVYVNQQILDPISSNMGISFTQQFPPTTKNIEETMDINGNNINGNNINGNNINGVEIDTETKYTLHDPRLTTINSNINLENINNITESNIYDPRQYGYGTSYRGYLDKDNGNVKYYYDDVDSIRRPNYITRSKIDFLPYANTYGPRRDKSDEDYINKNIRALANNSFLTNSIDMRTDLQEKLMRKSNAMIAQRRLMPLSRAH